jgi:hypothetical protein
MASRQPHPLLKAGQTVQASWHQRRTALQPRLHTVPMLGTSCQRRAARAHRRKLLLPRLAPQLSVELALASGL